MQGNNFNRYILVLTNEARMVPCMKNHQIFNWKHCYAWQ